MAPKMLRSNYRVEVLPRQPGDYGFCVIGGQTQTDKEWERDCDAIASQIRRHIDGIARHGVSVLWDNDRVCEHCGSDWTEKSDVYNGGCCSKDDENSPEYDEASGT